MLFATVRHEIAAEGSETGIVEEQDIVYREAAPFTRATAHPDDLDPAAVEGAMLAKLRLMSLAESLGGVETLISHPASMTHASVPPADRLKLGITDGLVRLSCGVEEPEDLLAREHDITNAFDSITYQKGAAVPVVITVAWALVAGVDLDTLWYAVVGFRADADAVLTAQPSDTIDERAGERSAASADALSSSSGCACRPACVRCSRNSAAESLESTRSRMNRRRLSRNVVAASA